MAEDSTLKGSGAESRLGESVRALRRRHNWSLATLAAKTGLAASTLSRVENNQLSLTYEKLLQLCQGLGVDLSELLTVSQAPAIDVAMGRRAYTAPDDGRVLQTDHYQYRYLCTELRRKKMTPIVGVTTAKSLEEIGGYLRHEGEEVVYVLDGVLEVHTEFYEPLRVEPGGCVYFDSTMGHAFVAVAGPVTFLSVCTTEEPSLLEAESRRSGQPAKPVVTPAPRS